MYEKSTDVCRHILMASPLRTEFSENARQLPPLSRRRDKAQLSCNLCRKRKLKCDRGMPCEACARRGLSLSCNYPASTPLQSGKRLIDPSSSAIQTKIANLEKLVLSMKSRKSTSEYVQEPGINNLDDLPQLYKNFGRIGLENTETNYVEGSHWTAILDGIAELKDHFDDDPDSPGQADNYETSSASGPALLIGNFPRLDRQQILSALPPKQEVDRLVSKYFNTSNLYLLIIHGPTFLEEYDRFWKCPQETSTMWIGLLFSIMCLACIYQRSTNAWMKLPGRQEFDRQRQQYIEIYKERVVQCLALADYTKCGPYALETLTNYLAIEYNGAVDSQSGLWVLLGMIVRIAVRMGYHRDGSHSPRLSPFQTEMRRRIWAAICMLDSSAADQYGLPRMINQSLADTGEPANLVDEDISPSMEKLPPPRPISEPTMLGFLAVKNRLLSTHNIVADLTTYPNKTVSYKQILKMDRIIQEQFESLPPALRVRPMSQSLSDSATVIANRLFLALLSYKSRCILHRDYLIAARSDGRYEYSRKVCIDAALGILRIQESVHEECQIGRPLYQQQWKFQSSVKHIFLLATTVLCVYLNRELSDEPQSRSGLENETLAKVKEALRACYDSWSGSSDTSREAEKAAEMLRIVLEKVQRSGRINHISRAVDATHIGLSSHITDPLLLKHDALSWENLESESPCDFGPLDPMLISAKDVNSISMADWNFDALTNESMVDDTMGSDWWATLDFSSVT